LHYFPIGLPFLFLLLFVFLTLIILIEINVLTYAFHKMGVNHRYVFALLLLSLLGSYINIPVYQLPPEQIRSGGTVFFFGVPYVLSMVTEAPGTVIAVNLGGAIIPRSCLFTSSSKTGCTFMPPWERPLPRSFSTVWPTWCLE
jgi:uncharacterized membrane protein